MGLEENKDEIHKAFTAYVEHAGEILTRRPLTERIVEDSIKAVYVDSGVSIEIARRET
jgi:hypothetical protein